MLAKKQLPTIIGLCFAIFLLVIDPKSAAQGTREGIELCLTTVIPSLFPFIVISIMLTAHLYSQNLKFLRPLGKLMRLPQNAEALLLVGFLGGYPVGAQNVIQAYQSGRLRKTHAERLLPICNNAGPAFIFGIGATILGDIRIAFLIWSLQIISSIWIACVSKSDSTFCDTIKKDSAITLTTALSRAIRVLVNICGWITLFRIIITYRNKWILCHTTSALCILISGLLELSNGCCALGAIPCMGDKIILFSVMLSFGGFCVAQQVKSLLADTDLSFCTYFPGKTHQAAVCFLLAKLCNQIFSFEESVFASIGISIGAASICCWYIFFNNKAKMNVDFTKKVQYNNHQIRAGGHTYEIVS